MEAEGYGFSKCMLLGGYLATNHQNTALVLALSPKVKCVASFLEDTQEDILVIHVNTHPFDRQFTFFPNDWSQPDTFLKRFERFILSSFHVFFKYIEKSPYYSKNLMHKHIKMTITGDSEFYTGKGKTGLGSSAATTVSIIKCLLNLFKVTHKNSIESSDKSDDELQLIFKLGSISHSLAQGSIGSCFDISCSVWGSQIFRRPSANFISTDMIDENWDNEHFSYKLPSFLRCFLLLTPFDGSSTVNLVRRFNEKAKNDPITYENLKKVVSAAMECIKIGSLEKIQESFKKVKSFLREISKNWEIEILPPEIDAIATDIEKLDGVVAVVIPGAGGYDSIAVLTKSEVDVDFSSLNLTIIASNSSF